MKLNILLSLIICFAFLDLGVCSLKCYYCFSSTNQDCADPFNVTANQMILQDCPPGSKYNFVYRIFRCFLLIKHKFWENSGKSTCKIITLERYEIVRFCFQI